MQPHRLNQTHRPTLALVQSQRPRAQALFPVRALTIHGIGIGITSAGGHEGAVTLAVGLKGNAAAAQGDDHSESAGGDTLICLVHDAALIICASHSPEPAHAVQY